MSFDTPTLQPDSPANLSALEEEELGHPPTHRPGTEASGTLSRAPSSGSFISAVSEHEALDMVNLQVQVSKPITDSPLLMSSYISHLTQLRCSHWNSSVGVLSHEEQLHARRFLSDFDMLEEGFSVIKMQDKPDMFEEIHSEEKEDEEREKEEQSSSPSETGLDWNVSSEGQERGSDFVSSLSDGNTSKTTLIVKFQGSIDVICCPIVLESLEKQLASLCRTFESLHPISVVNHLHAQSVDRVESKNTLKKEKSLDLQEKLVVDLPRDGNKGFSGKGQEQQQPEPESMRTFEKSISSYVQASLNIPKINIMVLQASVVEEICAFSALDRVRDITCVSLLALGIKDTTFQFCKTSQSKKTVQMFVQNPRRNQSGKKKKGKYKLKPDFRQNEPFTFESSETQREEVLMTGSVRKMHAQLRRPAQ